MPDIPKQSATTIRLRLSPARVAVVTFAVADDSHGDPHTTSRAPVYEEMRLAVAKLAAWTAQVED